ncbi:MAG: tetratricopeptide repeat protein, partial [Euryarchaeota archaeon]|nr:tetratricopeptide repeat protein [Euryarchaeota archaeon]
MPRDKSDEIRIFDKYKNPFLDEQEGAFLSSKVKKGEFSKPTSKEVESYNPIIKSIQRLDEAEKEYRKALEIRPDAHITHVALGNLFGELKRFDEAEKEYTNAIEIQPDNPYS